MVALSHIKIGDKLQEIDGTVAIAVCVAPDHSVDRYNGWVLCEHPNGWLGRERSLTPAGYTLNSDGKYLWINPIYLSKAEDIDLYEVDE